MKKYYLMTIDMHNDNESPSINAMYYLGCYYLDKEKNYKLCYKYYLMAIKKSNPIEYNRYLEGNYYSKTFKFLSFHNSKQIGEMFDFVKYYDANCII